MGTTTVDPYAQRREQMFPALSDRQIASLARLGTRRRVRRGELLFEQGMAGVPFFVVLEGAIEIILPHPRGDDAVTIHRPGEFTGETNMLTGRRSLARARALEDGEVLEVGPEAIRTVVQTDPELSELLMRAFILRRVSLIARGTGDAVLVGSRHSPNTLRLRDFLMRNGHPYTYLDVETATDVEELLHRFHIACDEIPVLICRGDLVLRNPTIEEVADCLGLNAQVDVGTVRDVLVIGGGPAGLAAAVYAASEGLDVLVIESHAPGGQAGSSSKIENYLGFPTGISGQALAGRAFTQAEKFGAAVAIARSAAKLRCERKPFAVELSNGEVVRGRALVIASGAQYRRLPLERLAQFEGAGVYYAASEIEAKACANEEVVVVGGGNSAGQAAMFLSRATKHVHILCRSDGFASTMSRYLVRRIEDSEHISLRKWTEVIGLYGESHLERVRLRCSTTREEGLLPIRHVFSMTGAVPNTGWLGDCLALDEKGFVKTGADLTAQDLEEEEWPLQRAPYLLETSQPGIFAVGDVRAGNVKRVASAVGEGSICVQLVHKALNE